MLEMENPPAGSGTVEGLKVVVGPEGETVAESCTLPPNPLELPTRIVAVFDDPAARLRVAELAEIK